MSSFLGQKMTQKVSLASVVWYANNLKVVRMLMKHYTEDVALSAGKEYDETPEGYASWLISYTHEASVTKVWDVYRNFAPETVYEEWRCDGLDEEEVWAYNLSFMRCL